jgi:hypothetical protein
MAGWYAKIRENSCEQMRPIEAIKPSDDKVIFDSASRFSIIVVVPLAIG